MQNSWWNSLRHRLRRTTVDSAIADLGHRSEDRRSNAAIWVWSRGRDHFGADERDRLAEVLRPVAMRDPDPTTRAEAIVALVALGVAGAVDLALTALRSSHAGVRQIVAAQIGATGDQRVVDALVVLLDDPDGFVREAATIGLELQGDPRALEPLRAMVRRERKDAVAKAGAKRTIRALEKQARRSMRPLA
jgi:HEAT repeat protein